MRFLYLLIPILIVIGTILLVYLYTQRHDKSTSAARFNAHLIKYLTIVFIGIAIILLLFQLFYIPTLDDGSNYEKARLVDGKFTRQVQ